MNSSSSNMDISSEMFEDEIYEEDDEQDDIAVDEKENQFLDNCVKDKESNQDSIKQFKREISKPTETAFILFSYYRDTLIQLALQKQCNLRFTMNKLKITSDVSEANVDECHKILMEKLESIHCFEINKEKTLICFSPHFIKEASKLKFKLAKFNNKLYSHSDRLTEPQLKKNTREVIIGKKLFQVNLQPVNVRNQNTFKTSQKQMFTHINAYAKKVLSHLQNQFQSRKVVVEFDANERRINCIGESERDVLAVKNTLKNSFESMVILVVNYQDLHNDDLDKRVAKANKYADEIATYPVLVGKVSKKIVCMISKDNIMKKLIKKKKMLGYLKFVQQKCEIGMFFVKIYHFREKKAMIDELCSKKGYDLSFFGSIFYYFKKIFKEDNEEENNIEILELLNQILEGYEDAKEKYNIPSKFTKNRDNEKEEIGAEFFNSFNGQFYQSGETTIDEELSNLLRRDVRREKLKMAKNAFVRYKLAEGEERKNVCWQRIPEQNQTVLQKQEEKSVQKKNQKLEAKFQPFQNATNSRKDEKVYFCKEISPTDMKPKVCYYNGNAKDVIEEGEKKTYYFYDGMLNVI